MTHAFKLAKRIARNRIAQLLVVMAVNGCATDLQQPTNFESHTAGDSLAAANGPGDGYSRANAAAVTALFVEGFEDSNLGSRYWYDNRPMTTSATERVVGSRSLEARYNAGSTKPSWGVARRLFTPSSSVYVTYWVKYSSNWQSSANGSLPHEFSLITNEDSKWAAPGSTRLTLSMQHSTAATALTPLITWNDRVNIDQIRVGQNLVGVTEQRAVSGCNGDLARPGISVACYRAGSSHANLSSLLTGQAALRRNVWQRVELFVQLNTVQNGIGQANGILRYSVDGELIVSRNDLLFRTGARPNMKFSQFFLAPYLPSAAPVTQYVWYDDLQVLTAPAEESSPPPPPIPVAVASVEVAPTSLNLQVGQTGQIAATPRDAGGNALTGRVITWSSSAPGVAAVNSVGLVTAVAPGNATITATSEGRSAAASVTVAPVPVASVSVTPVNLNLQAGQTGQIVATPRDAGGNALTGRVVTWSSSAPSVVAVNDSGRVTGLVVGSATITATSEGRSATSSVTVGQVPVASVAVSPASLTLQVGQTGQVTATLRDASGNALTGRVVTWSSSATGVATVSSSGLVTGVAAGTATVTATSEGRSTTAAVTVAAAAPAPVASVALSPTSLSLQVAQTGQFTATLRDAAGNVLSGRAISWSSTAPLVASVSSTGRVTALVAGSTTIRATSEGRVGSATVTVGLVPVASVSLSPTSLNLQAGQTAQITATLRDALGAVLTGRAVAWTTSSASVATVSSSGLVTAQGSGTATISATSEGRTGNVSVSVAAPVPVTGGSGGNLAEPVYNVSNPDHKLHVHETWGSLTGISNLYSQPRSDGGLAWVKHAGTANGTKYLTLVNQGDGFGSVRHISIDFTSDPPIAPHGIVGPYTAAHAGFHWANGGGDDNVRAEAGVATSAGSSTLTDATKNWPVNYWAGHGAYISSGPGAGVQLDVISNTATTLTVAGSWGATAGSNYSIGADGPNHSWIRGLDLGRWGNKPAKDAVVVEWAIRQRGTNWYEGKNVDMGAGQTGGTGRWLFDHFSDPLGVGGTYTCSDLLCRLYYSNSGATPLFPNMPPTARTTSPAIHRSAGSHLTSAAGSSYVVYKQNRAYGSGPGQFIWGSQFGVGPQNANLLGTSTPMYQAGWLYCKIRITREPHGSAYAYGRGRLEMWIGQSPGSLTKVMEYLGDVGQLAAGKVWVAPTDAMVMPDALEIINFFAPTARIYKGGAIVDLGTVRVWSHSRQ